MSDDFPTLDMDGCFGYRAVRAARALTRYYNQALKPVALQGTQLSLLAAVQSSGPSSVAVLAENLATDASTLVRNIAVLEGRGLVLSDSGRGRGGKRVSVTREGEVLLEKALPLWYEAVAKIGQQYGPEKSEEVLSSLRSLEHVVDAISEA